MLKIGNKKISGELRAVSSKSYSHRIILMSILKSEKTKIYLPDISEDILATIENSRKLFAKIQIKGDYILVDPIDFKKINQYNEYFKENENNNLENIIKFDFKNSGTTLRLMLPIITTLLSCAYFKCDEQLKNRPLIDLINVLKYNGVVFKDLNGNLNVSSLPFYTMGKFKYKIAKIRGDVSSQYISGILFSSILQETESKIILTTKLKSKPYVNITLDVLREFNQDIKEIKENNESLGYLVKKSKIKSKDFLKVEGDFSNSAVFLVAGAISNLNLKVRDLNINSIQGDRKIISILREYGKKVIVKDDFVKVVTSNLKEKEDIIKIDVENIPDLFPILVVLALNFKGKTFFYNFQRLKLKESNRIKTTMEMVLNLGGEIFQEENKIIVIGKGKLKGGFVNSYNDHRIAMAASILSTICLDNVYLKNENAVEKSYKNFYNDLRKLGQIVEKI